MRNVGRSLDIIFVVHEAQIQGSSAKIVDVSLPVPSGSRPCALKSHFNGSAFENIFLTHVKVHHLHATFIPGEYQIRTNCMGSVPSLCGIRNSYLKCASLRRGLIDIIEGPSLVGGHIQQSPNLLVWSSLDPYQSSRNILEDFNLAF